MPIGFESLETRSVTLGFIALVDCAPLVVAREKGFFRRQGLDVMLLREGSWASLRDRVALGVLDGGHMLQALPLASIAVPDRLSQPMVSACVLNLGGNGITVSAALWQKMAAARSDAAADAMSAASALAIVVRDGKERSTPPLTFAVTFPYSSHNYELRLWLAAGGIDPDRDVRLVVVPPQQMLTFLTAGRIDGYCVGAPWNALAAVRGVGRLVATKADLWENAPEKVLGVRRAWAERHPNTHRALVRALIEACQWLDDPAHPDEAAELLARPGIVNAPASLLAALLTGWMPVAADTAPRLQRDALVFHRYAANFPWRSQALWTLRQMRRWGQLVGEVDLTALASQAIAADTYRAAAAELGIGAPAIDDKSEGTHASGWTLTQATAPIAMGPDRFFAGRKRVADDDGTIRVGGAATSIS
jgi:nitrate/nitrite transport system substrate-binding protein